jgi:hypothetical protein
MEGNTLSSICPLCNSLTDAEEDCPACGQPLIDSGRLMDYFDDYSAYLEIEGMKRFDGIAADLMDAQCPHVLFCSSCEQEWQYLIVEIPSL